LVKTLFVWVLTVAPAFGSIITPTAVTSSLSTFGSYSLAHLIDGTGLSATGPTGTVDNNFAHMWLGTGTTGTLTFDLGAKYSLTDALVWNYNYASGLSRSVDHMDVLLSDDNVTFTPASSYTMTEGNGSSTLSVNDLTLPGASQARYVKFSLTQNFGDPTYIGLSEVEFEGTVAAPTPEPSTFALGLVALALVLLPLRRAGRAAR
jgi:hypothetical protein